MKEAGNMPNRMHEFAVQCLIPVLVLLLRIQTAPAGFDASSSQKQKFEAFERSRVLSAKKIQEAMRAWNTDLFEQALKEARSAGALPDWMLEYQKNCLRTCPKNSILLTKNLEDTVGFYFLQEVDAFRRDVRVLPFSLLKQPWYLSMMKCGDPLRQNLPDPGMTRSEIRSLHHVETLYAGPYPETESEKHSSLVRLILDHFEVDQRFRPVCRIVLTHFLRKHLGKRPIHLNAGSSCSALGSTALSNVCHCGLTYGLRRQTGPDSGFVDWKTMKRLLLEPDHFRAIQHADSEQGACIQSIRKIYEDLALHLLDNAAVCCAVDSTAIRTRLQAGPLFRTLVPDIPPEGSP